MITDPHRNASVSLTAIDAGVHDQTFRCFRIGCDVADRDRGSDTLLKYGRNDATCNPPVRIWGD